MMTYCILRSGGWCLYLQGHRIANRLRFTNKNRGLDAGFRLIPRTIIAANQQRTT